MTSDDVHKEFERIRQLLGAFALPLVGKGSNGVFLDVHTDSGELDELPLDFQPPRPWPQSSPILWHLTCKIHETRGTTHQRRRGRTSWWIPAASPPVGTRKTRSVAWWQTLPPRRSINCQSNKNVVSYPTRVWWLERKRCHFISKKLTDGLRKHACWVALAGRHAGRGVEETGTCCF